MLLLPVSKQQPNGCPDGNTHGDDANLNGSFRKLHRHGVGFVAAVGCIALCGQMTRLKFS